MLNSTAVNSRISTSYISMQSSIFVVPIILTELKPKNWLFKKTYEPRPTSNGNYLHFSPLPPRAAGYGFRLAWRHAIKQYFLVCYRRVIGCCVIAICLHFRREMIFEKSINATRLTKTFRILSGSSACRFDCITNEMSNYYYFYLACQSVWSDSANWTTDNHCVYWHYFGDWKNWLMFYPVWT